MENVTLLPVHKMLAQAPLLNSSLMCCCLLRAALCIPVLPFPPLPLTVALSLCPLKCVRPSVCVSAASAYLCLFSLSYTAFPLGSGWLYL